MRNDDLFDIAARAIGLDGKDVKIVELPEATGMPNEAQELAQLKGFVKNLSRELAVLLDQLNHLESRDSSRGVDGLSVLIEKTEQVAGQVRAFKANRDAADRDRASAFGCRSAGLHDLSPGAPVDLAASSMGASGRRYG